MRMTYSEAMKIVLCCQFDGGVPMEKSRLEEARAVVFSLEQDLRSVAKSQDYAVYLQSDHWQKVRQRELKAARNACRVCRSKKNIEVHHATYERLGCEEPTDVCALCEEHHELFQRSLTPSPWPNNAPSG